MPRRVLVGGIWHETNSFSPVKTDLDAFRRYLYLEGEAVISGSKPSTLVLLRRARAWRFGTSTTRRSTRHGA